MRENPSQHYLDLKAEKTLLAQTINLTPFEVSIFLATHAIPRSEYDYICKKYSRVIEEYKKEKLKL